MKPGAYLFLVTPDVGSLFARMCGSRWPHLIRQHLYYFDRFSLNDLLVKTGFETVVCRTYTRRFKIGYVLRRAGMVPERFASAFERLRLAQARIPLNVGDAMFVVARKAE
jgi:hypothetical protein